MLHAMLRRTSFGRVEECFRWTADAFHELTWGQNVAVEGSKLHTGADDRAAAPRFSLILAT
jgi:hypothetical protein